MRIRILAIAALALTLTGCGEPEHVLGSTWVGPRNTPGGREYTPKRAIEQEVAGWAVLGCQAAQDLRAQQCVLLGESPKGYGLGEAGLRMREGLTTAHGIDGQVKPGGWALVPIVFCPAAEPECAKRVGPVRDAFLADVRRVLALRRTTGCAAAIEAASKLDQPALESEIRGGCAG